MDKILNVALYLTYGLVLSTLNLGWGWQYWSLLGLLVIIAHQERTAGRVETSTVMLIVLKDMGIDTEQLVNRMVNNENK